MTSPTLIPVICTLDDAYVPHGCTMLASLFAHNRDTTFIVTILTEGLRPLTSDMLRGFVRRKGHECRVVPIDATRLKDAPISDHISLATYYRLLIPEFVGPEIEKALFLDTDLIVRKDIRPLWETDIGKDMLMAVENPFITAEHRNRLGIPADAPYFNAGMMLLNVQGWRECQAQARFIETLRRIPDRIRLWDQDVLNAVFCGRWRRLDPTWNAQAIFYSCSDAPAMGLSAIHLEAIRRDPAIVHFCGAGIEKPWQYGCRHPFASEYRRYRATTPWRQFVPLGQPPWWERVKQTLSGTSTQGGLMKQWIRLANSIGLRQLLRWGSRTLNHIFFIRLIGMTENFESVRWMKTKIAQNILDLWTIQETIAEIKPRVIIECGTYEGGSALFYANLFDLMGTGRIISIDIANRCKVTHPRIRFLRGSSVSPDTVSQVREWMGKESPVMVILDSDHSAPHVLKEMEIYGSLVTPGSFMLVQDGVIDLLPIFRAGRPGPLVAIRDFLKRHDEFEVDLARCNRFLITHHPMGWLRRKTPP